MDRMTAMTDATPRPQANPMATAPLPRRDSGVAVTVCVAVTICVAISEGRVNVGESELHRSEFAHARRLRDTCETARDIAPKPAGVTSIASMISCRPANGLNRCYQHVNSPSNSGRECLRRCYSNRVAPASETVVQTYSLIVECFIFSPRIEPVGRFVVDGARKDTVLEPGSTDNSHSLACLRGD